MLCDTWLQRSFLLTIGVDPELRSDNVLQSSPLQLAAKGCAA
jgi:hypothetical protein